VGLAGDGLVRRLLSPARRPADHPGRSMTSHSKAERDGNRRAARRFAIALSITVRWN
jgi:hypothetical protein